MIVKVGDKIKCKEDTMDFFLKSGEIAYVSDIVEIVTKNGTYYVELNYDDFVEVILDYEWHVFENIVDVIEHSTVDDSYVESRPSSRGKLLLRTGDIISVSKLMRSKNV